MNVSTITMPVEIAREKLRECRTNMHRQADQEYQQLAAGYEALAKGTPLIDIANIFRDGEYDEKGRPRLAIGRADRKEIRFEKRSWGDQKARFLSGNSPAALRSRSLTIEVDIHERYRDKAITGFALTPMIPPDKIPATGHRENWHILWEVEAWADRSHMARSPVDPILLKHIGGTLYAILAEWDLTPLEQAIINGAMRT